MIESKDSNYALLPPFLHHALPWQTLLSDYGLLSEWVSKQPENLSQQDTDFVQTSKSYVLVQSFHYTNEESESQAFEMIYWNSQNQLIDGRAKTIK